MSVTARAKESLAAMRTTRRDASSVTGLTMGLLGEGDSQPDFARWAGRALGWGSALALGVVLFREADTEDAAALRRRGWVGSASVSI